MTITHLFLFVFFLLVSCICAVEQIPPLASACHTLSENYLFSNCIQDLSLTPQCHCNSLPWLGSLALCISEYDGNDYNRQQQWPYVASSGGVDASSHSGVDYYMEQQQQWQYVMSSRHVDSSVSSGKDCYKRRQWQYVTSSLCGGAPDSIASTLPMQDILVNAIKFVTPLPANATTDNLLAPIRFPPEKLGPIVRTINEFNNQLQYGLNYGNACSALVGIFVILGMLNNLFHHCISWRYNMISNIATAKPKALPPSPSWMRTIRCHVINPSLFFDGIHLEHASWFGVMVNYPTRFESICIFLYVTLNVFLLFPRYDLFLENTYWPGDIPAQLGRYIADRSGELSFAQLPMVYLFGGRNNILIWLTGWNYDRFIIAHKWTSRMMIMQAVVHSAAYTWTGVHEDFETYLSYYDDPYFQWGVAAMVLGFLVLLFALPNLRRKCYDFFLYTHIALVVLFTMASWYHVALLEDKENMPFLYVSIAVWSFDRVARFVRVVYYNFKLVACGRRSLRSVKADIIQGTDCVRFRVDANKSGLSRRLPGAFVYIYLPQIYFWQSHPFTIASWHHQPLLDKQPPVLIDTVMIPPNVSDYNNGNKKSSFSSPKSAIRISDTDSILSTPTTTITTTFDLLIRPQKGMTKKLYDTIKQPGPDGGDISVLIEGPYGHTHPVLQYNTAILVGGGVGCTATVPYLQEAVYNMDKIASRHLVFIWVVQQVDQLNWAQQDIVDCLSHVNIRKTREMSNGEEGSMTSGSTSSLDLDVFMYVTRSGRSMDQSIQKQQGLVVSYGVRPDLDKLLGQYIETAHGSVAILHCGPARMSDQIRQLSARHGVAYMEEAFEW